MSKDKKEPANHFADAIEKKVVPHTMGREVLLSVIIPTQNCSEQVGITLDSIKRQNYPRLEVIVVDATSRDRTLEVVNAYTPLVARTYSVAEYSPYHMINRGLTLASGRYVTAIFPGSFYLSDTAFLTMAHAAMAHDYPALIYVGTIQREAKRPPTVIHGQMDREELAKGRSPATLPACWFRSDVFEQLGKFRTDLFTRSAFEYLCRLSCKEKGKIVRLERVLIDYNAGPLSYSRIMRYATDTWRILLTHFGFWKAFVWFLGVNHIAMLKWLWHNLKERLFAQNKSY